MARILAFVLLAGCVPTTFAFSPTVNHLTSKPETCPVDVMTSPPTRDFQEVGTLEFYNGTEPTTLQAFKEAVGKQVCGVGGDAVIAVANPQGQFTKGTVIAYTDSGAARRGATPAQQNDNELPK